MLSLARNIVLLLSGATGAGRHEARVCIIRKVVLLCCSSCSYPFACSLASHTSRITASQSAHSCRLTIHQHNVAYGLPSHFHRQSINQLGNACVCGTQQEPSIDFLPSLCHHSALCPSPLEPQESRPSSVCCLTPYGRLLRYRHRV